VTAAASVTEFSRYTRCQRDLGRGNQGAEEVLGLLIQRWVALVEEALRPCSSTK